ncbi:SAGA HAT/Core module component [Podila humilis]|nr:SAGA HAT/Core module component [Podila humilis]
MDRKNRGSRTSMDDALDESSLWKNIVLDLQRLSELRDSSDDLGLALDGFPEGSGKAARSVVLCQEAIESAREEKSIISRTLDNLSNLLYMREADGGSDSSAESKRKKRKIEAEGLANSKKFRRYSSADSNGIIPVGHQVAARTPKDKDKQEEWILARVLNYSSEKNKYRVEDDEADDSGKKMTYTLSTRSVIMIVDDQEAVPEFPAGHTVLALYPSTTCFYKAVVVQPPSKNKDYATPVYRIKFDDDGGNERTAPPRMVLDMPKAK